MSWGGSFIPRGDRAKRLALRELRGLACLVEAGLLALYLPRIARQEAFALQRHPQLRVRLDERAGDTVPDGSGLAGEPAAVHTHAQVVLALEPRHLEGRRRDRAPDVAREILVEGPAVDPRCTVT